VERLLTSPLLSPTVSVSGHVYDVATGRVTTTVDARAPVAARPVSSPGPGNRSPHSDHSSSEEDMTEFPDTDGGQIAHNGTRGGGTQAAFDSGLSGNSAGRSGPWVARRPFLLGTGAGGLP
jgi:hypothetical protein